MVLVLAIGAGHLRDQVREVSEAPTGAPAPNAPGADLNPSPTTPSQATATARPSPAPSQELELGGLLIEVASGRSFSLWNPAEAGLIANFSRDGRWLAYTKGAGGGVAREINVVDLSENQPRPVKVAEGQTPRLSPDGALLAFLASFEEGRGWRMEVREADGTVRTLEQRAGSPARWSSDGRWLSYRTAFTTPGADMSMILVDTQRWSSRTLGDVYSCNCDVSYGPFWSPDSRWLVYRFAAERHGFVVSPAGARLPVDQGTERIFQWSPDGRALLTEGNNHNLLLHEMEGGTTRVLVQLMAQPALAAWSPDGMKVGYQWADRGRPLVSVVSLDGRALMTVAGTGPVEWAAGSAFVAVADGGIAVYRAATGAREHLLSDAVSPAWSPSASAVAYVRKGSEDGCARLLRPGAAPPAAPPGRRLWEVSLLEVPAGKERPLATLISGCMGDAPVITWSPDGRFIALCDTPGLGLCSSEANERGGRIS